ncbi:hypothetical protein QF030_000214 [Streptomyces rishiriensis]|uniref:Uncharacterized protein n=1 Tax=Streptomyces rishiriensis TaxID=68264 RepID=A0ABU0NG32_STRRH|nr:hypothetical protein [Streptomyces rishiriensis]
MRCSTLGQVCAGGLGVSAPSTVRGATSVPRTASQWGHGCQRLTISVADTGPDRCVRRGPCAVPGEVPAAVAGLARGIAGSRARGRGTAVACGVVRYDRLQPGQAAPAHGPVPHGAARGPGPRRLALPQQKDLLIQMWPSCALSSAALCAPCGRAPSLSWLPGPGRARDRHAGAAHEGPGGCDRPRRPVPPWSSPAGGKHTSWHNRAGSTISGEPGASSPRSRSAGSRGFLGPNAELVPAACP